MSAISTDTYYNSFRVDALTYALVRMVQRFPGLFIRLGNLETRWLRGRLAPLPVQRPVFIAGMARAASTILLEYLAAHRNTAVHRYRDFPFIHIPCWWSAFLDRTLRAPAQPTERSHHDGIMVTAESPEAMEEVLWQTFFPKTHDAAGPALLDESARNSSFERFYLDHIRKLCLLRKGSRYIAKNNNSVLRLEYVLRLFPDCKIIIPIREPSAHVASCMKQQRLFCEAQRRHPRSLDYLRLAGHYEFGIDRRPLNAGAWPPISEILEAWRAGHEAQGWALYWAHLYGYVWTALQSNDALREAAMLVRFEELCADPPAVLKRISAHCGLEISSDDCTRFAARIRYPAYYQPEFSVEESGAIRNATHEVAARFGYGIRTRR